MAPQLGQPGSWFMLNQPMSARQLGRKAAAAFPDVSKARITLYRSSVDRYSDEDAAETAQPERPQAAAALLRQLRGLSKLRRLHLAMPYGGVSSSLTVFVPQLSAQHLQVLDLTEIRHSSSVLPTIAAHLTGLQELVMTTMAPCKLADIASLAAIPSLRNLTCVLERPEVGQKESAGLGALTQITNLKMSGARAADAVMQMSALTSLISLCVCLEAESRPALQHVLPYMQSLEQLEAKLEVTDDILEVAASLPKLSLLHLYFGYGNMDSITSKGIEAVARVPNVELWYCKGLRKCCRKFTSLPNIKRFHTLFEDHCFRDAAVCTCHACMPVNTQCRKVTGGYYRCCGWCRGQGCSCKPTGA